MRVETTNIDDFCSELAIEAEHGRIHENIVRVRIDRIPEQDEAISFEVSFWSTAVIDESGGQYVLELGLLAGRDTQAEPNAGSETAADWEKRIQDVCEGHDLTLRHGKIEVI